MVTATGVRATPARRVPMSLEDDRERVWRSELPPLQTPTGIKHGLSETEFTQLTIDLRRWARWVQAGRKPPDVFRSGAAAVARFGPRVIHGPPAGGYGPGVSAPPEEDADDRSEEIDRIYRRLPPFQRSMMKWRYLDGRTTVDLADQLASSERAVRTEWRKLYRELFARLYVDHSWAQTNVPRPPGG